MYFIYDEEYLDEDDVFDYTMSPSFESFEKAANHGTRRAIRDNKTMVTLITERGMIISFWNPLLDAPKSKLSKSGKVYKYKPKWVQKFSKKGELEGKSDPPDIPDICPEFDVE